MGDSAPNYKENEERTLKKIKAVKYQNIDYRLKVVNETQLSIMNRQARIVPHFSC